MPMSESHGRLFAFIKAETRVNICETLERIRVAAGGEGALATARGTLAGIAEWLEHTHGRAAAYEILQHEADELINRGGNDNAGTPRKREGKDA